MKFCIKDFFSKCELIQHHPKHETNISVQAPAKVFKEQLSILDWIPKLSEIFIVKNQFIQECIISFV